MLVYSVKNEYVHNGECIWLRWQDALEEIKAFLTDGDLVPQTIILEVKEMTKEEYFAMDEFSGY